MLCILFIFLINKKQISEDITMPKKNLKKLLWYTLIILPDSFIRYHYPPMLTFAFPVNIAPRCWTCQLWLYWPGGFSQEACLYIFLQVNSNTRCFISPHPRYITHCLMSFSLPKRHSIRTYQDVFPHSLLWWW